MTKALTASLKATATPKLHELSQLPPTQERTETHLMRHLRTPEAARFLGVSTSFLNHARIRGNGPRYRKLSPKLVVYATDDLLEWSANKARQSTSGSELT